MPKATINESQPYLIENQPETHTCRAKPNDQESMATSSVPNNNYNITKDPVAIIAFVVLIFMIILSVLVLLIPARRSANEVWRSVRSKKATSESTTESGDGGEECVGVHEVPLMGGVGMVLGSATKRADDAVVDDGLTGETGLLATKVRYSRVGAAATIIV